MKEFLTGAGTDAPEVDDENVNSRRSIGYEDMWAKTLLETYEVEVHSLQSFVIERCLKNSDCVLNGFL